MTFRTVTLLFAAGVGSCAPAGGGGAERGAPARV
jgi:hypothetical protein